MQQLKTWEYHGRKIAFTEHADFITELDGKNVRSPSLDAAKRKIDAHIKQKPFDPFKALRTPYFLRLNSDSDASPEKIEAFNVNGIEQQVFRRGRREHVFLTDRGGYRSRETNLVTPDTAENRKLISAFEQKLAKAKRTVAQMEDELVKEANAIPRITADDYAAGKTIASPDTDSD